MPKSLEKILKANMPMLTELIRSKGRNGDTILAHINPKEAALLQAYGGSGGTNPETGLPEFQMDFDLGGAGYDIGAYQPPMDLGGEGYDTGAFQQPVDLGGAGYDTGAFQPAAAPSQTPVIDWSNPAAVAASPLYKDLYPGGVLPTAGQETYMPQRAGIPSYRDVTAIPTVPVEPPGKSWYEDLGLSKGDVTRLGLGALAAVPLVSRNVQQTKRAQQQAAAREAELKTIGEPYQRTGRELQRAAQAGELTPASQRALDVARAQMAQATATRGGVGAEQASAQIAALQNQMLQAQYDLGLRVAQIGDQYVSGAIRTGMQADQMINQANNAFYASLAQMAAPFILGQQPVYAMGGYPTTRGT